MRKIIAHIDDSGVLYDKRQVSTGFTISAFEFDDYKKPKGKRTKAKDILKLVGLGLTADDISK